MIREIKFRAWDKESGFFQDEENIFINQDGGVYREEEAEWYKDRYEIQLYSGLNDKNGKEIYEGDIVKYSTDSFGRKETFLYQVKFENGQFRTDSSTVFAVHQICKVVGNIYEEGE